MKPGVLELLKSKISYFHAWLVVLLNSWDKRLITYCSDAFLLLPHSSRITYSTSFQSGIQTIAISSYVFNRNIRTISILDLNNFVYFRKRRSCYKIHSSFSVSKKKVGWKFLWFWYEAVCRTLMAVKLILEKLLWRLKLWVPTLNNLLALLKIRSFNASKDTSNFY